MNRSRALSWRHKPLPELIRLAWPISVSMISHSVMTLVDTLFVGRLGSSALAAVSMGGVFAFTLLCFGLGALRGVRVLISQAAGADKLARAPKLAGAGVAIGLGLGVIITLVGWLSSPIVARISASAQAGSLAVDYIDIRLASAAVLMLATALREAALGVGDAKSPMRAAVASNVVNIGLDYLLIVQHDMGVSGAALATAIAVVVDAVWLLVVVRRAQRRGMDAEHPLGFAWPRVPSWRQVAHVWRIGLSTGTQFLLEVGSFAMLTGLLAAMSELDVAAHQIALQAVHFAFLPAYAIGEAASVMAGQAVGAGHFKLVPRIARLTLALAGSFVTLCALVFCVAGRAIAAAFSDDPALIDLAVKLLYVAAAFQLSDAANIVARSMLRGVGDVRFAAVISVTIAWAALPPLTLLLGYGLRLGALGAWLAMLFEISLGAAVLWWRFQRRGWVRVARATRRQALEDEGPASGVVPATA